MANAIDLSKQADPAELKILVAIPALNEEKTIAEVIDSIWQDVKSLGNCEVLVVNDGSKDHTAALAKEHGAHVVSHSENRGVGACFQQSLNWALKYDFDILVTIDGDGQFDTLDIPRLVEPIAQRESDFVTGSRFCDNQSKPEHMSSLKFWGNHRVSQLVSSLTGQRFYDVSCGFRAYSREAVLWLNLHGQFTYTHETFLDLCYKNLRIKEVPINVRYFEGRKSRVASSISRYAIQSLTIMLRSYRDYQPLKFFWILSASFSVPALALAVFFFGHFLMTNQFSPHLWAGALSGFLMFVALIFFVLGILADAQGRMRVNQERQLYLLKKMSQQK